MSQGDIYPVILKILGVPNRFSCFRWGKIKNQIPGDPKTRSFPWRTHRVDISVSCFQTQNYINNDLNISESTWNTGKPIKKNPATLPKFDSSPLKSDQDPIIRKGKRLSTTIFQGRAVKLRGGTPSNCSLLAKRPRNQKIYKADHVSGEEIPRDRSRNMTGHPTPA